MIIALESQKPLFKDDQAYQQFLHLLRDLPNGEVPVLTADKEVLCGLVSPAAVRELLARRIQQRLQENPEIFSTLKKRLESDDIVE